ncbi:Amino acid oxidase fmpA like protein [Verticillium longisporum]|nr:Amino acid oxidase fmpA like protein [Verticillium longisporum]
MSTSSPPSSILIIGSGVFGLSTALALALRPAYAKTEITVLDRSPEQGVFPSHDASSIDSSRIIRPDYADPAYSALAATAHHHWRHSPLGEDGRYTESGMALIADAPPAHVKTRTQMDYVRDSYANVKRLAQRKECGIDAARLTELPSRRAIAELVGLNPADADTDTTPGDWGYLNGNSGWADAGRSMQWLLARVQATGRVRFVHGTATALLRSGDRVTGARLADASTLLAALVIVATGAWTGALVDLAGQAVATGQVLAYVDVTPTEAAALRHLPIVLNLSTGLFTLVRENQMLRHRIRDLERQLADATPGSPSLGNPNEPAQPSNLTRATSIDEEKPTASISETVAAGDTPKQ